MKNLNTRKEKRSAFVQLLEDSNMTTAEKNVAIKATDNSILADEALLKASVTGLKLMLIRDEYIEAANVYLEMIGFPASNSSNSNFHFHNPANFESEICTLRFANGKFLLEAWLNLQEDKCLTEAERITEQLMNSQSVMRGCIEEFGLVMKLFRCQEETYFSLLGKSTEVYQIWTEIASDKKQTLLWDLQLKANYQIGLSNTHCFDGWRRHSKYDSTGMFPVNENGEIMYEEINGLHERIVVTMNKGILNEILDDYYSTHFDPSANIVSVNLLLKSLFNNHYRLNTVFAARLNNVDLVHVENNTDECKNLLCGDVHLRPNMIKTQYTIQLEREIRNIAQWGWLMSVPVYDTLNGNTVER